MISVIITAVTGSVKDFLEGRDAGLGLAFKFFGSLSHWLLFSLDQYTKYRLAGAGKP